MYVNNAKNIKMVSLDAPGVANVKKQILIGPAEGWEGWVMRLFTVSKNGYTPKHTHPWPHINYVINGQGSLYLNGDNHDLKPGSVAYVPGGAEHQFKNAGEEDLTFICIVPEEGEI